MTKERISQLLQSTIAEDVEMGLMFVGSFALKDIKEMFPGGSTNRKSTYYTVKLNTILNLSTGRLSLKNWIKYHHGLYLIKLSNSLTFHSQPKEGIKYTLYGES